VSDDVFEAMGDLRAAVASGWPLPPCFRNAVAVVDIGLTHLAAELTRLRDENARLRAAWPESTYRTVVRCGDGWMVSDSNQGSLPTVCATRNAAINAASGLDSPPPAPVLDMPPEFIHLGGGIVDGTQADPDDDPSPPPAT
jgi:hypothetical protein